MRYIPMLIFLPPQNPRIFPSFSDQNPPVREQNEGDRRVPLAVLGGNTTPSAADLNNILGSVGVEADEERIELLLSQVKGKDITESEPAQAGGEKLASVPSGSGGGVAVATGGGGGATAAPPAAEAKKEDKVEEQEESDEEYIPNLFD